MKINSEKELLNAGEDFAKNLQSRINPTTASVIELIGDVGTGKTTFTRGLARGLGIKTPVTSPSFTISKSYPLSNGGHLIHYDFYRLSDPGLMADDLAENLQNPLNIIVIEWGQSVSNFLPAHKITIRISYDNTGGRNLAISK